jgi:hypothetical protein
VYTGTYINVLGKRATLILRVLTDVHFTWNILRIEAANSTGTLCLCIHLHGIIHHNTRTVITLAERTLYLTEFAFCNDVPLIKCFYIRVQRL